MAEEELGVVKILDNYYRDSFGRVVFILSGIGISIFFLAAISLYLFLAKPAPVVFPVGVEWRMLAPVPIEQPYLSEADTLQWVSNVVPQLFNASFRDIDYHLQDMKKYFTDNGYEVYLNQFNNYVDKKTIITNKMYVHGEPAGAPIFLNQGVLSGRYAWSVQFPVRIRFEGTKEMGPIELTFQVLVVRTETTNNLAGVLIDNLIAVKGIGNNVMGTSP